MAATTRSRPKARPNARRQPARRSAKPAAKRAPARRTRSPRGAEFRSRLGAQLGSHSADAAALALLVAAVVARAAVQRDRGIRLCAWCALLPIAAGVAVTLALGKNVVLARYLIVAQVFLPIAFIGALRSRLALAPVAVALGLALVAELPVLAPAPDVPVAAAWIDAQRQPGDRVIVEQFYYWSFRIRDPDLVMLTPRPQPIQVLGAALIGPDDTVIPPAELPRQHGRLFVVDSAFAHAPVPPAWRRLAWARFPVAFPHDPKFDIQVSLYDAP